MAAHEQKLRELWLDLYMSVFKKEIKMLDASVTKPEDAFTAEAVGQRPEPVLYWPYDMTLNLRLA